MKRRDEQLGAALRGLDVPDHAPDFFARLERELDAADREDRAERDTGAPDALLRPERPARGSARRARPALRRWRPLSWGLAAAAVAAVVLLAVMAAPRGLSPDRTDPLGPGIATAAEIKAKVTAALEQARALRGVLVVIGRDAAGASDSEMRWHFAATARGDFALRGSNLLQNGETRAEELAYDAGTGRERAWSRDGDETPIGGERVGLAAGPPDPGPSDWILQRDLGGVVRALLAADAPTVAEATYEGRPAWVLGTPVDRNLIADDSADHMEVTVDRATGFPVRVVESSAGRPLREMRLEDLEIDPELAADAFTVVFPPDMTVVPIDEGFRPATVAEAAALVGYEPPLPSSLPEGFEPGPTTVAEEGMSTGKEGTNPQSLGVVSTVYRRGFDVILVSSRLTGSDPALWSDPLAGGEGFIDRPERVTLGAGAFAGAIAEVLIDPRSQMPHLWVMDDELVVTVAGDLTRAELIAVAESLVAGGGAAR